MLSLPPLSKEKRRLFGLEGRKAFVECGNKNKLYEPDLEGLSQEEKDFLQKWIIRTEEEYLEITGLEQGTPEWLASRRYRVTGSTFATPCMENPYQKEHQLIREMLKSTFKGNEATERGNRLEPEACAEFVRRMWVVIEADLKLARQEGRTFLRFAEREYPIPERFLVMTDEEVAKVEQKEIFEVRHEGLVCYRRYPWIAASPDGVLWLWGELKIAILEIKCPFKDQWYPCMPLQYYAQALGNMLIQNVPVLFFCVYSESKGAYITQIEQDEEFCHRFLVPALNQFYFKKFLRRAIAYQKGIDAGGEGNVEEEEEEEQKDGDAQKQRKRKPEHPTKEIPSKQQKLNFGVAKKTTIVKKSI